VANLAIFGAVAGAIVCWAASEVVRGRARRILWSVAALLMLVHSVSAFGTTYRWSHEVALAATARQTRELTGLDSGGGIYINYIFLLVWLGDAAWWWRSPASHAARAAWISRVVHGFVWFMFLNGAVIFADGWMRVIGGFAVFVVLAVWVIRR
jgi:hypothetical protein